MQDTSIQQWNALRPIVDETVSYTPEERSFFCVGDVKQSIYGWRNACPEILSRIDHLLGAGAGIVKQNLATSYRSSQPVIDVVNKIFTDLITNPAVQRYPDAACRWDEEFVTHTTSKQPSCPATSACAPWPAARTRPAAPTSACKRPPSWSPSSTTATPARRSACSCGPTAPSAASSTSSARPA
jgi:hypothetical protein